MEAAEKGFINPVSVQGGVCAGAHCVQLGRKSRCLSQGWVNTRAVYWNINVTYLCEYEYSELLIIRIQILHEGIRDCIHEYF